MRRLSIIDLEGGSQPICSESGACVVSNGEIYNFRELRTRPEGYGHSFRTRSDTEVIVRGFDQWGFPVLERLSGMFGIALWDPAYETLVLARDPYGVKPLYFKGHTRKYVLREAVKRGVPGDVLRRKKIPFQSPIDRWLRTDLAPHAAELLLSPESACAERFRPAAVGRLLHEHIDGKRDNSRILLSLVVFELRHRQFIAPSGNAFRRAMIRRPSPSGEVC